MENGIYIQETGGSLNLLRKVGGEYKLISSISYSFSDKAKHSLFLESVCTKPNERQKGYFSMLMTKLVSDAKEKGIDNIQLKTSTSPEYFWVREIFNHFGFYSIPSRNKLDISRGRIFMRKDL